jgi:hypothetical protein
MKPFVAATGTMGLKPRILRDLSNIVSGLKPGAIQFCDENNLLFLEIFYCPGLMKPGASQSCDENIFQKPESLKHLMNGQRPFVNQRL